MWYGVLTAGDVITQVNNELITSMMSLEKLSHPIDMTAPPTPSHRLQEVLGYAKHSQTFHDIITQFLPFRDNAHLEALPSSQDYRANTHPHKHLRSRLHEGNRFDQHMHMEEASKVPFIVLNSPLWVNVGEGSETALTRNSSTTGSLPACCVDVMSHNLASKSTHNNVAGRRTK